MANPNERGESTPDAHGNIFKDGPFQVEVVSISNNGSPSGRCPSKNATLNPNPSSNPSKPWLPPPKPLMVALPREEGEYPVMQFHHGFTLQNTFYSQLISHIASHGFIVVAPQMYTISGSDATLEITTAATILNWLPKALITSLPPHFSNHKPNFQKVALGGHSRGGKVVYALALNLNLNPDVSPTNTLKYSALVLLDPVDGMGVNSQTNPPILTFKENSLKLEIPILVIGTGLGPLKRNALFPPCAPEGVSHRAFYHDSGGSVVHLVAKRYGHNDFLDDECAGVKGRLTGCVCRNGAGGRGPFRRWVGGVVVGFLGERGGREGEGGFVEVEDVEWKGELVGGFKELVLAMVP